MAARMHNLRISSDHSYPVNIIQRFMDSFNEGSKSSLSQINDDDDDDEFENADEMQRRWAESVLIVHVIPGYR